MNIKSLTALFDLTTRRKRRAATSIAIDLLENVLRAEESFLNSIASNLSAAYINTNDTVDYLLEAVIALNNAYE